MKSYTGNYAESTLIRGISHRSDCPTRRHPCECREKNLQEREALDKWRVSVKQQISRIHIEDRGGQWALQRFYSRTRKVFKWSKLPGWGWTLRENNEKGIVFNVDTYGYIHVRIVMRGHNTPRLTVRVTYQIAANTPELLLKKLIKLKILSKSYDDLLKN